VQLVALALESDPSSAVGADIATHSQVCAHEVLVALLMRLEETGVDIQGAFGIHLERTSTCPTCRHSDIAAEPGSNAHLDLYPQPGSGSIQDVLNSWQQPELVEWRCQQACCPAQNRYKQLAVRGDAAPPALVLHVSRIAWDRSVGATGASSRVDSGLEVSLSLNVATHVRASGTEEADEFVVTYVLDAAVLHMGATTIAGTTRTWPGFKVPFGSGGGGGTYAQERHAPVLLAARVSGWHG
jgi:Ubiquitin carboxyl-terminal hydrolase